MEKKKFNIFPYLFIFLASFLILQYVQGWRTEDALVSANGTFTIETVKDEYAIGKDIKIKMENNTEDAIRISDRCPETPFDVYLYSGEGFTQVTSDIERNCNEPMDIVLESGEKHTYSLLDYSYSYFGETGRYKLELSITDPESGEIASYNTPEFEIKEPGFITKAWRNFIYKPILNALIAILIYMPGHHLGLAIIFLTLVIRTLLLAPSQKSIKAQRNMQELQPKLDKLKEKYKGDQARLTQETMLLWKEHKVNPLSSCMPLLIQFPVLIALFYVISRGLSLDKAAMIYDFLPSFSLIDIDPMFLSFDLLERSIIVFPLIIGGLQFTQMQLMMSVKKKKKGEAKEEKKGMANEMESANKMMKYIMPVMIAFFTAQMPAAVGLYWGTSTFYGIIQQLVVNKGGFPGSSQKDGDVKVRIINKKHGKKD